MESALCICPTIFFRVLRHGVKGAGSLAKLEPPSMHPQVLNSEYLNRPQRTSNCSKMDIFHPRTKVRLSLRLQKKRVFMFTICKTVVLEQKETKLKREKNRVPVRKCIQLCFGYVVDFLMLIRKMAFVFHKSKQP